MLDPQPADPPRETASPSDSALAEHLAKHRAEIDRVDRALHDLLMQRAEVVGQVAELGRLGKVPYRPGREAAILRRLLDRHTGRLPPQAVVRIWREIFAGNISLESRFVVAACDGSSTDRSVEAAREHFGALTPLRLLRSPEAALADVQAGRAAAAVLPGAAPSWLLTLLFQPPPHPHVVARLPFWAAPRAEGAVTAEAFVVAAASADPSGCDRTLIGVRSGRPLDEFADIGGRRIAIDGSGQATVYDVPGLIAVDDPRLRGRDELRMLGSYAVPLGSPA